MKYDYGMLFDANPIAQILIDPYSDKLLTANAAACSLLGRSAESMQQQCFSQLFGKSLSAWIVFSEEVLHSGDAWNNNLVFVSSDNKVFRVELSACRMDIGDRTYILINFQDAGLLERRRVSSERQDHYQGGIGNWARMNTVFQEFEKENQLLLEAAGEGIYGIDGDGNTTFVNPAGEQILGWKAEELLGKNAHKMFHHSHRTGASYQVEDCPIYHAFRDGIQRNIENEVFWTKDGKAIDVEYTSTPIKDSGEIMGAVVVFRDVTQKRVDQGRLLSALSEVESLKNRLEQEKAYLQEEIRSKFNHTEIVGKTSAVAKIQEQIELVAPTNATVLISGESGTGKELIARAIHESSSRSDRPIIRVNCAAIPPDLFESEMFGHSKGAFTGATASRVGRFELADGGTLFLDEVGEIPLSLQGKLLVVLQEQQFERVGESKTRKVDVRIIAATNRELGDMVKQGGFRDDLFFRLNVFPIESVALRYRIADIPLLAEHFLVKIAARFNKPGLEITDKQMEILQAYHWPGNIRELENVIEREVILAQGSSLSFDGLAEKQLSSEKIQPPMPSNKGLIDDQHFKAQQKQNIIAALERSRGKIFGEGGAAELLGVKPTTLSSRLKRYNIDRNQFVHSELDTGHKIKA